MIYAELGYIIFCIAFAYLNYQWIKKGKRIKHFWNGMLHLAVAIAFGFIWSWWGFLAVLCNANLSFNISLNLFRGLPLDYVTPTPKAVIDILEQKIFKRNGILPKIIYLIGSIVANIIYYS